MPPLTHTISVFNSLPLLNRLDMPITIDAAVIRLNNTICIVIKTHKNDHPSVISKNIEHIAFQMNSDYRQNNKPVSIIEYRENPKNQSPEWRQWQFQWVGNTPLNGEDYPINTARIKSIKEALQRNSIMTALHQQQTSEENINNRNTHYDNGSHFKKSHDQDYDTQATSSLEQAS